MPSLIPRLVALIPSLLALVPAHASDTMTFKLGRLETSRACGAPCAEFIVADGAINLATAATFIVMNFRSGERNLPIILQSPGGNISGALALAKAWRQLDATVIVATAVPTCSPNAKAADSCPQADHAAGVVTFALGGQGECASACTIALAGATKRVGTPGSKFGVHAPGLDADSSVGRSAQKWGVSAEELTRDALAQMARHFREFGIEPGLIERTARTAHADIDWLTLGEAEGYRLINAVPADLDSRHEVLRTLLMAIGRR